MSGVVFSINAKTENDVVTCMLALTAQTAGHQPEKWIEPGNGASQFRNDLYRPVMPFDVRKLVDENDADPVIRPALRIGRQQHATMKDAPGADHLGSLRSKKPNRSSEMQRLRNLGGDRGPVFATNRESL